MLKCCLLTGKSNSIIGYELEMKFWTVIGAAALLWAGSALAFQKQRYLPRPSTAPSYRQNPTALRMSQQQLPILEDYKIDAVGRLVGRVHRHPDIEDGDRVTTSPIENTSNVREGSVVTTQSGSKYRLGKREKDRHATESPMLKDSFFVRLPKALSLSSSDFNVQKDRKGGREISSDSVDDLPVIDDWGIQWNGRLVGRVSNNHPVYKNGDVITTSAIQNPSSATVGKTVTTYSGSQYKLGKQMPKWKFLAGQISAGGEEMGIAQSILAQAASVEKDGRSATSDIPDETTQKKSLRERKQEAKQKYELTGKTAASGKFLISGKAFRSTSGKSNIYSAYRSDDDGLPIGDLLAVKVSTNCVSLTRENENYERLIARGYGDHFVKKHDFLDGWGGPSFANACALVLESGTQDLKSVMHARGGKRLEGPALRDAAYAAALCVQAMHTAGLVWTDIKPENFIVTSSSIGHDGLKGVKGIDLESAMPLGKNPVDYSPEACPPEFARDYHDGAALDHVLNYDYDIWSLGMLLFELSTGRSYFETETPQEITQILSNPDFSANVRSVKDRRLRNLIGKCLQRDPCVRPNIKEIIHHPYFLTTSLGWY